MLHVQLDFLKMKNKLLSKKCNSKNKRRLGSTHLKWPLVLGKIDNDVMISSETYPSNTVRL